MKKIFGMLVILFVGVNGLWADFWSDLDDDEGITSAKIEAEAKKRERSEEKKAQLKNRFVEAGSEGFDELPWKTTVEEFQLAYLQNREKTSEENKKRNERVFSVPVSGCTKEFYFFDNKLYKGVISYLNPKGDVLEAIGRKQKELYKQQPKIEENIGKKETIGDFYGTKITKNIEARATFKISPTFSVQNEWYTVSSNLADAYFGFLSPSGSLTDSYFDITVQNDSVLKDIDNYLKQKHKAEIEAKMKEIPFY